MNRDSLPPLQKAVAMLMSFVLIVTTIPAEVGAQTAVQNGATSASAPATTGEYAPLAADELDGLVAPIALYPDALVAQVLGAATFPYEVVNAGFWLKDNSSLTEDSLAKAVDEQPWDPAVKALTQFPSVLDNLAKNLAWTSALGEASAMQQQDVMAAIQRMRAKARAAGTLKSGSEIKVVQESPQTIIIQPANPQVVYVPTYNPTVVYGAPVVTPGYSSSDAAAAAIISFGVGIAVGAMINGGCCGWGWGYWGTNWRGNTIIYNRNVYVGNRYWRGGYYGGGYRPGYPVYRPPGPGYRPGSPSYRPPAGSGYPGYGRPPGTNTPGSRPPATTLPTGPGTGNRPNRPGSSPGTKPGGATPTTLPANPGNGQGRIQQRPGTASGTLPSTNEARGYRPQTGNTPSAQPARPNAFSGSGGGRPQSARGNQSLAGGGNRGGASRK